MSRCHLVIPDQHAHPNFGNERADWLGRLIVDLKPDVIVNIGDAADMPSLSSYDKGKRSYQGKSYAKDIEAHLDFQDRLFSPMSKQKKKKPYRVFIEGNHEQRIERALDLDWYLNGTISFDDLKTSDYYDDTIRYSGLTPGVINIDGVFYSHYFASGVLGKPVSGEHQAYTLLTKKFLSCTQGHSHTTEYCIRNRGDGHEVHGLVLPCYIDYEVDWAGQTQRMWNRGLVIKRGVSDGAYDLEYVSLSRLRKEYA